MIRWFIFFAIVLVSLTALAQDGNPEAHPKPSMLAFKLVVHAPEPTFAFGTPITFEAACVTLAFVPQEWQERWDAACSDLEVEVEQARLGAYWGGMSTFWIENRLHLCLLPAGEEYEPAHREPLYTEPHWHSFTIPVEKLKDLRGLLAIGARAVLKDHGEELDQESGGVLVAVTPTEDNGTDDDLRLRIEREEEAIQSGHPDKANSLTDAFLESPTPVALRIAVKMFDNTDRNSIWTFIENAPQQQLALDLMEERIQERGFVPDYYLLLHLTGMRVRSKKPLEFQAAGQPPYPEITSGLEDDAVAYFRFLLALLVNSQPMMDISRKEAVEQILASVQEQSRCALGTYGMSSEDGAKFKRVLQGK